MVFSRFTLVSVLLIAPVIAILLYNLRPAVTALVVAPERRKPSVSCKAFTQEECKGYLGKDVISAGYKPLLITIINSTDQYFMLSPSDISLKIVAADIVAQSVYSNTMGHIVGWGIASLVIPVLLIPGIALSAISYEENRKLENSFREKALQETTIAPKCTISGVVFVALKDYKDMFTIALASENCRDKIYYEVRC